MTNAVSPNGSSEAAEVKKATNSRLSRFGSIAKYPDDSNVGDESEQAPDEIERSFYRRLRDRCFHFYWTNEFICLVVVVILLAYAYPPLGAEYLAPDITATWIAVILIFSKWLYYRYIAFNASTTTASLSFAMCSPGWNGSQH
jgi:hypothetical protein